ncbi:putative proton-dependent oligopeptide transporter family, MFS transporter superfamily [Helianthus annuus]|nr:putative proton-dependent oligopeptide transporter family, MFS transporter superfamily [Helianthus annuus]KAJ0841064.1 putative proton-dependent oligopeptide transporter family, MFS transporter superfamily [Helianthus annuus]
MAGVKRFRALNKPCVLLIVIAGIERFVFKGVGSNLVIYLTEVMQMTSSSAAQTVNGWTGFTSMVPLLVAPLVDSYWNRYSTILASSCIYLIGLLALTSTALNKTNSSSSSLSLYISLYLISLGIGGYNPSLQAFGADQIDTEDELPTTKTDTSPDKKSMFFQWWYFGICSGSLLGVSIMPNIQDSVGWGLGFAVPAMAMAVSMIVFSCGSRFYSYDNDRNNDVKSVEKVVQAVKSCVSKFIHLKNEEKANIVELELEDKPLCIKGETETECLTDQKSTNNNSNHLVKILKVVIELLPIWTTLLMFAVIFQQPATFFIKQGMSMKRNIGHTYKIPPATLQSAITISIVLLMPFYDTIFIPFTRLILRNENGITTMQRIAIGMFLSVIAMIFAATVEMKRLQYSELETLSIFWLLPQYVLLGISDIFTVVGMQEFFYSAVPEGMRTMGIALYTSVFGVGSFLSAFLVFLVEYFTTSEGGKGNWFADDMREARLDNYYWLLAGTSTLSLVVFVVLCTFQKTRQ